MDAYIRQHKVWTPKQMHESFFEKVQEEVDSNSFTYEQRDSEITWTSEPAIRWLNTENGQKLAMDRFTKKYEKDKPVADRKSPLVERVRFGLNWDNTKYGDINFGLKGGYNFIGVKELESLTVLPWTIEHVNNELESKYEKDLLYYLNNLSTSYLEKIFAEHWVKEFYDDESNPALIPEVCGLRAKFYYYEINGGIYSTIQEIPINYFENYNDTKVKNFRYDFLIANFKRQKIAFIELDGFEYHKTRDAQTIDSIKRNTASSKGISLLTFTSKRINEDIEAVFLEIKEFLK